MNIETLLSVYDKEKQPDNLITENVSFRVGQYNRRDYIWLMLWDICHYQSIPVNKAIEFIIIEYHKKLFSRSSKED